MLPRNGARPATRTVASERVARLARPVPVVAIEELESLADIVIECAPAKLLSDIIGPFLRAGKAAMVLSCGALLRHDELVETARRGRLHACPDGAGDEQQVQHDRDRQSREQNAPGLPGSRR